MAGLLLYLWEYTSPFIVSKWEGSLDFATNIILGKGHYNCRRIASPQILPLTGYLPHE
jgi:hypothetical protein